MMFPKPVKKEKDKTPYNSLQGGRKKEKKPVPEWKQGILAHHHDRPSKADRGEFPRKVISELIEEAGGACQSCRNNPDTTTHHVMPRGRSTSPGRGVKTNGLRLCWQCHDRIQTNEEELQQWINYFGLKYGPRFWYDEQDWEEYNRKQTAIKEAEEEQKQRLEQLSPIVNLLTVAANRKLKAAEVRLLDGLDDREMAVFAKLMSDVVGSASTTNKVPFGYGHFND